MLTWFRCSRLPRLSDWDDYIHFLHLKLASFLELWTVVGSLCLDPLLLGLQVDILGRKLESR